jgi:hypothetical protein
MNDSAVEEELYYIKESAEKVKERGGDVSQFYAGKISLYVDDLKDSTHRDLWFFISLLLEINKLYKNEIQKSIKL